MNIKTEIMRSTKEKERVNVAIESTNGHFVENAKEVDIKSNWRRDGVYFVKGSSTLVTTNHTTLDMKEDCLITPQRIYSSVKKRYIKVID